MKVKIKSEDESHLEFELKETSSGFVNGLRRLGIGQLKVFAIDSVMVYENTTHFFDEFIVHRIGMLPITTPVKLKGDEEVVFTMDVQGPGTIYSKDFSSNDKDVKVAFENIPILRMKEGHVLRLEGKAILGNGRKKGKFQPGLFTYNENKDGSHTFYVETFHNMSARNLMLKTIDMAREKYDELEVALKEAK